MPIDLASTLLLPSNKRQVCFLSIAIGLMVDVDIGTESMRWLGDTRFVLGFLRGIASNKSFKCRIHLDVRESDKIEMARKARERVKAPVVYGEAEARAVEEVRQALGQAVLGDGDDVAGNAGQTQDEPSTDGDEPSTSKADAPGAIANDASGQLPEARKLKKGAGWLTIESGTAQAGAYPKPHTENAMPAPHGGWPDGQGLLYL
jgi:sphingosine kinase